MLPPEILRQYASGQRHFMQGSAAAIAMAALSNCRRNNTSLWPDTGNEIASTAPRIDPVAL